MLSLFLTLLCVHMNAATCLQDLEPWANTSAASAHTAETPLHNSAAPTVKIDFTASACTPEASLPNTASLSLSEDGVATTLNPASQTTRANYEHSIQVTDHITEHHVITTLNFPHQGACLWIAANNTVIWDTQPSPLAHITCMHTGFQQYTIQLYTQLNPNAPQNSPGFLSITSNGNTCGFLLPAAPAIKSYTPCVQVISAMQSTVNPFSVVSGHTATTKIPLTEDAYLTIKTHEQMRSISFQLNNDKAIVLELPDVPPLTANSPAGTIEARFSITPPGYTETQANPFSAGATAACLSFTPFGHTAPPHTFVSALNGAHEVTTTLSIDGGNESINVCAEKSVTWTLPEHTLAVCNYTVQYPTTLTTTLRLVGRKDDHSGYTIFCLSTIGTHTIANFVPSATPSKAHASTYFLTTGKNNSSHIAYSTCTLELLPKNCIDIILRDSSLSIELQSAALTLTYNKQIHRFVYTI